MSRVPVSSSVLVLLLLLAPFARAGEEDPDPAVAEMSRVVDEIMKEAEEVRGLTFKTPFARKLFTPEELKALAIASLDKELPPELRVKLAALDARVGFYPPGTDIGAVVTDFLAEGVAGFYDPEEKTLSVQRGFSPKGSRPIILHELIHALEDQYFDLGGREEATLRETDRHLGLAGLVEGSATWFMTVYMSRNLGSSLEMMKDLAAQEAAQEAMMARVPVVLTVQVGLFPYLSGMAFVQGLTGGDPEKVSALYDDPPVSSEQVLHPEKYRVDFPHRVSLPALGALLPEGWSAEPREDILGELSIGVLVNEFRGGTNAEKLKRVQGGIFNPGLRFGPIARRASEGWDGDRIAGYFGPDGAVGFAWASRWDTERDANEFAAAYRAGVAYKARLLGIPVVDARVEVRGDRVLIVEGFPADRLDPIAMAVWAGAAFVPDPRDEADVAALRAEVEAKRRAAEPK